MKIAVLLKYFQGELNPFDGAALECALATGEEVTAVAMAPASVTPLLENLTRLGIKAVLLTDPAYAGSDTLATSLVLARAMQRLSPDVIFAGRQSMDGDTAQVPPMVAQRLGFAFVPSVVTFESARLVTRGGMETVLKEKTVFTFERIRSLRFPSIFSKKGSVELWDNEVLGIEADACGMRGSPTRVVRSYESAVGRRDCRFVSADDFVSLIEEGLVKKTERHLDTSENKADEIYYVGDVGDIAERYALRAKAYDATNKSAETVAAELASLGASIVLFESNEVYKTLASRVAVLLEAGLCADCISFRKEGERFIMTRPALGGTVTADIVCTSEIAFATVRKNHGDEGEILFAIGRGALPYKEKISALAERYGASLAASRVAVDEGEMPYECQVGLTGKTVSPQVYVAFGISGAVQHTAAIAGAGTVIAVNTDKNARIFDYSDFGIVVDINHLLEEK
ncbi:MAG: FAD-binding protein [Clostridia bacterium]|nr:FAD-binding protein [Clostridia bacterium]